MIVEIFAGLGNQMFQYAFYLSLKKKWDGRHDVQIDNTICRARGYELEKVFGIKCGKHDTVNPAVEQWFLRKVIALIRKTNMRKIRFRNQIIDLTSGYWPEIMEIDSEQIEYYGCWQSENYFSDVKEEVKQAFRFPEVTEEKNKKLIQQLQQSESVSIHVRRGDFLKFPQYINLGESDYYQHAIEYIKKHVKKPVFVVFSDDVEWCKEYILRDEKCCFVDWNTGDKSFRDMQLMSICKHNIIANSTFSWWGAWINENKNKIVVAPSKIYSEKKYDDSEYIPEGWIKL